MRKTLVARRGRAGRMLGVVAQQGGKICGITAEPRQRRAETGDRGQLAGTGAPEGTQPARPAALVGKASATSAACGKFSAAQALPRGPRTRREGLRAGV